MTNDYYYIYDLRGLLYGQVQIQKESDSWVSIICHVNEWGS